MTIRIPHVIRTFKTIKTGQTFKRETNYVRDKAERDLQPTSYVEVCQSVDEPEPEPFVNCVDETEGTREFYRRGCRNVNKRWNQWASNDLEPLPRRTVVNKFKKNKGLLYKRGTKYETSKVNKRAKNLDVKRDRAMKYNDLPLHLQESRLREEEDAYWSVIPSYHAEQIRMDTGIELYLDGYQSWEDYWYTVYHELPTYKPTLQM